MTAATMTLTEFLLARIAEDEEEARQATPGPWWFGGFDFFAGKGKPLQRFSGVHAGDYPSIGVLSATAREVTGWVAKTADEAHAARHNPARVLAECEAKRRIVELAREAEERYGGPAEVYMDGALGHLAAVYSDHPDYRDEWAV